MTGTACGPVLALLRELVIRINVTTHDLLDHKTLLEALFAAHLVLLLHDDRKPMYLGGTTVQVNVGGPTPEARRYAEILQQRPELLVSMTEVFDRLDGIIEGNVAAGSTEPT